MNRHKVLLFMLVLTGCALQAASAEDRLGYYDNPAYIDTPEQRKLLAQTIFATGNSSEFYITHQQKDGEKKPLLCRYEGNRTLGEVSYRQYRVQLNNDNRYPQDFDDSYEHHLFVNEHGIAQNIVGWKTKHEGSKVYLYDKAYHILQDGSFSIMRNELSSTHDRANSVNYRVSWGKYIRFYGKCILCAGTLYALYKGVVASAHKVRLIT